MNCLHQNHCGGCSLRHLPYNEQLTRKLSLFKETLRDGIRDCPIECIPATETDFYRHKMEFSFGVWDDALVLGMHEQGKFYKVIDITQCMMQSPESNIILDITRQWAHEQGIPAYHRKRQQGVLRYLIIRQTRHIPGIMVHLFARERIDVTPLITALQHALPPTSKFSFYLSIHRGVADTAIADETFHCAGELYLEEMIGACRYAIGPFTFFQSHATQIEHLYNAVKTMCGTGTTLLDLFCGVGGFALYLAHNFENVYGVESNESSVQYAQHNAVANGIRNATFFAEDAAAYLNRWSHTDDAVTMVIDPPRCGLTPKMIRDIISCAPKTIVYVSCNPKTLARDIGVETREETGLAYLEKFYTIARVVVIDMFPNTNHLECAVKLNRT